MNVSGNHFEVQVHILNLSKMEKGEKKIFIQVSLTSLCHVSTFATREAEKLNVWLGMVPPGTAGFPSAGRVEENIW